MDIQQGHFIGIYLTNFKHFLIYILFILKGIFISTPKDCIDSYYFVRKSGS